MLVSNALLALTWNYIQPLIEKTREELEMHGEDSAADALEDLLGDEVSSGAPLPTGKAVPFQRISNQLPQKEAGMMRAMLLPVHVPKRML